MDTHTRTHTHKPMSQTKAITRNQAYAWFKKWLSVSGLKLYIDLVFTTIASKLINLLNKLIYPNIEKPGAVCVIVLA